MSKENNGGPAFPQILGERYEPMSTEGMSLRDYFAAKAMQGIMSRVDGHHPADTKIEIGQWCYRVADAMLKAREKLNKKEENNV